MLAGEQLVIVIFGTVIAVLVLMLLGYCACYKQKTHHHPKTGRETDPLLGPPSSPLRPGSPQPSKPSGDYGELGKTQVTVIQRWIDNVSKANGDGFKVIEEFDSTAVPVYTSEDRHNSDGLGSAQISIADSDFELGASSGRSAMGSPRVSGIGSEMLSPGGMPRDPLEF